MISVTNLKILTFFFNISKWTIGLESGFALQTFLLCLLKEKIFALNYRIQMRFRIRVNYYVCSRCGSALWTLFIISQPLLVTCLIFYVGTISISLVRALYIYIDSVIRFGFMVGTLGEFVIWTHYINMLKSGNPGGELIKTDRGIPSSSRLLRLKVHMMFKEHRISVVFNYLFVL